MWIFQLGRASQVIACLLFLQLNIYIGNRGFDVCVTIEMEAEVLSKLLLLNGKQLFHYKHFHKIHIFDFRRSSGQKGGGEVFYGQKDEH